jgi:hypothetical protein
MGQAKKMEQEQLNVQACAENPDSTTSYSTAQWGCEVV